MIACQPTIKKLTTSATVFLTATAFTVLSVSATLKENTSFAGEWTLNEQKSDLGQFGARIAAKKLKVMQTADALTIERTVSFNGEDRTSTDKLTLDGKESENAGMMNSKKTSTAKWSEDGQTLTVNSTTIFDRNGEKMEMKSTDTWKLSDAGKTLSLETNSTSQRGTFTVKALYEKAK